MSIYKVLVHPNPRLKLIATNVTEFNQELKQIVKNMYETMYEYNGIGLAATQVDIQKKIIVMDVPLKTNDDEESEEVSSVKLTLINPEILSISEELESFEEGCLSVPGQYSSVTRPETIVYRYQDTDGNIHEETAKGLLAICIQHEMDHLNGILFIDHISRIKRERIEKKLAKHLKTIAD